MNAHQKVLSIKQQFDKLSQISKYHYGTCENFFKERHNNHTATFRNKSKQRNSRELSKHIWELKAESVGI